ncbi:MAG: NAD(+) diphosphatase [bacterium]|nr:NAD(+) diphosphatase [bacterium]
MEMKNRTLLNYFATANIDRMAENRKNKKWLAEQHQNPLVRLVPVWRELNLVTMPTGAKCQAVFPTPAEIEELYPGKIPQTLLGKDRESGIIYYSVQLPGEDDTVPEKISRKGEFIDLRRIRTGLEDRNQAAILGHAKAITYWQNSHRYCAKCGKPTRMEEAGHLLVCTGDGCKREHYPRTDAAVIVLVSDGDKCLLGRGPQWPKGMYSTIAGFVEPGESLELAVAREDAEETGIRVDPGKVHYHSSQPWPFPASIMLGFMVEVDSSNQEICIDPVELEDARWFTRHELNKAEKEGKGFMSSNTSIAYRLINEWRKKG